MSTKDTKDTKSNGKTNGSASTKLARRGGDTKNAKGNDDSGSDYEDCRI